MNNGNLKHINHVLQFYYEFIIVQRKESFFLAISGIILLLMYIYFYIKKEI